MHSVLCQNILWCLMLDLKFCSRKSNNYGKAFITSCAIIITHQTNTALSRIWAWMCGWMLICHGVMKRAITPVPHFCSSQSFESADEI